MHSTLSNYKWNHCVFKLFLFQFNVSPIIQQCPLLEKPTNRETKKFTFHLYNVLKGMSFYAFGQDFSSHLMSQFSIFPLSETSFLIGSPIVFPSMLCSVSPLPCLCSACSSYDMHLSWRTISSGSPPLGHLSP